MAAAADAVLLARLRRFADRELKIRQLAAALIEAPDDGVVAVVALVARVTAGDADADVTAAVGCLPAALAALPYPARQALYLAARARDAAALQRAILDASPPTADADAVSRQLAPERPLRARSRPLTLGERKALARRPRGPALDELLRDPHPDVVAILLDNPQLTEREVVRIAASRPAVPEALAHVAQHRRWSTRAAVRRALVLNPHTPVHIALRLLVTLAPADWDAVAASSEIAAPVQTSARELGAQRRARGG